MPIYIRLLCFIALSLSLSIVVHAQENEAMQLPPVETREVRQEERALERSERRTMLTTEVQSRVRNLAANVINRLSAALGRMDTISTRLESRISTMNREGFDTIAATRSLGEARAGIERARGLLATTRSIDTAVVSETPRESYQAVRTDLIAVRDEIRRIHQHLRDAVAALRQATPRAEVSTESAPQPDITN